MSGYSLALAFRVIILVSPVVIERLLHPRFRVITLGYHLQRSLYLLIVWLKLRGYPRRIARNLSCMTYLRDVLWCHRCTDVTSEQACWYCDIRLCKDCRALGAAVHQYPEYSCALILRKAGRQSSKEEEPFSWNGPPSLGPRPPR